MPHHQNRLTALVITTLFSGCAGLLPDTVPPSLPGVANPTSAPQISRGFSPEAETQLRDLLVAMRDLLNTSSDLARNQFAAKQTAVDPALDRRWLNIAEQLAPLQKLPIEQARSLIQAQIEASNFAKQALFTQWETEPSKLPPKPSASALADARIGDLIKYAARAQAALKTPGAKARIEAIALEQLPNRNPRSEPTRRLAIAPLLKIAAP